MQQERPRGADEARDPEHHPDEDATQAFGSGDSDAQHQAREEEGENLEPVEGSPEDYDREAERVAEERREAAPHDGEAAGEDDEDVIGGERGWMHHR